MDSHDDDDSKFDNLSDIDGNDRQLDLGNIEEANDTSGKAARTPKSSRSPFSIMSPLARRKSSTKSVPSPSGKDNKKAEELEELRARILANQQNQKSKTVFGLDSEVFFCSIFWVIWWALAVFLLYLKITESDDIEIKNATSTGL
mmetsp:Transcript_8822/g.22405  ORF Transcript_8822/g.22405 Transcript_8822/m.22405 type:complete len:145 (+) Transcript_8822:1228-1662(+)